MINKGFCFENEGLAGKIISVNPVNPCQKNKDVQLRVYAIRRIYMSIKGYIDYQRREFCKDVQCQIQLDLNKQKEDTEEYGKA